MGRGAVGEKTTLKGTWVAVSVLGGLQAKRYVVLSDSPECAFFWRHVRPLIRTTLYKVRSDFSGVQDCTVSGYRISALQPNLLSGTRHPIKY